MAATVAMVATQEHLAGAVATGVLAGTVALAAMGVLAGTVALAACSGWPVTAEMVGTVVSGGPRARGAMEVLGARLRMPETAVQVAPGVEWSKGFVD